MTCILGLVGIAVALAVAVVIWVFLAELSMVPDE